MGADAEGEDVVGCVQVVAGAAVSGEADEDGGGGGAELGVWGRLEDFLEPFGEGSGALGHDGQDSVIVHVDGVGDVLVVVILGLLHLTHTDV